MTAAHEFWTFVLGILAAIVGVMLLLAGAYRLWTRRLVGPIPPDTNVAEYADKAADEEWRAITAAVDPDFAMWEAEVSS